MAAHHPELYVCINKPHNWVDFVLGLLAGACCACAQEDTIRAHPAAEGWQALVTDNSMFFGSCDVCQAVVGDLAPWQVFVFSHAPIIGSALRVLQERFAIE